MNWKIKQISLFLFVIFVFIPVHAGLHVLRDNLDQLVDDLNVLEVRLTEVVIKNRQLAEVQRRKLEQQQRIDREKRLRQEELNRLAQEQREREIKAQLDEELRLEQERERQVAERKRLEEQERIDREKRLRQEELNRLAEQREREIKAQLDEKLRLQQERERQEAERQRLEEQERIDREKRDLEEKQQEQRKQESKQRVELRLEQLRAKLAAEKQRLKEKDELSFSRITTVPYDVGGDWVGKFVEEIDPSGKLSALDYGGYIFLGSSSLFKGSRHRPDDMSEQILENYYKPKNYRYFTLPREEKRPGKAELKQVKKDLVGLYKIHLMPQNANDFMIILEKFIKALEENSQLQNAVNTLKVKSNFDFESDPETLREKLIKKWGNEVPPIIVIAPSLGKENAQIVLDTVYNLFKDVKGLDLTPRFNEKINDLIYYAQGNSNDKQARPEYFSDDLILYKPDFVSKENPEDYHLKNPATK